MTPRERKQILEQAIVADLRNPHLTYVEIAVRRGVGTNKVQNISKTHGLTRPRGQKTGVSRLKGTGAADGI